jgi:hypothetical protein
MSNNKLFCLFLIVAFVAEVFEAMQIGDRMPTSLRTLHSSWKTPWLELPLHNSPRFRMKEMSVIQVFYAINFIFSTATNR